MILYTPLAPEAIFPVDYSFLSDVSEYRYGDLILQGRLRDGKIEVYRLISTNLDDYLNPNFAPGSLVDPPLANC